MRASPCSLNNQPPVQKSRLQIENLQFLSAFWSLALIAGLFSVINAVIADTPPPITILDPPEKEFFSKLLDYHGLPIKAHAAVSNEALYAAYDRLSMLLSNQPVVLSNLIGTGAELHIIGRDQV